MVKLHELPIETTKHCAKPVLEAVLGICRIALMFDRCSLLRQMCEGLCGKLLFNEKVLLPLFFTMAYNTVLNEVRIIFQKLKLKHETNYFKNQ